MTEADVLRIIVSLIFVIMLILAGAWLTRRAGWLRSGKAPALRVLGAQSLGGRAYVAMVEVEDARLVVGVTPTQVSLLHTLPPAEPNEIARQQQVSGKQDTTGNSAMNQGNTSNSSIGTSPEGQPGFAAALNRVLRR